MKIAVVTRVPDAEAGEAGNMAIAIPLYVQPGPLPDVIVSAMPHLGMLALSLRAAVFALGEILILDNDGREFGGERRKPSKWDVGVTECETLEEAAELAATLS